MTMQELSDEIKYRLSDLGVQIGNIAIEYITELEKENAELKADYKVLSCSVDDFGELQEKLEEEQRKNNGLEAQIERMKCCGNCAKNGHICVAEEMQGKLCGKNKVKWELRR